MSNTSNTSVKMNKHAADCAKFSPNMFNKTKCQNCFRPKDAHSAQALESNRASRRVSKCGYLFVAPDWDFSVSINRSKRWQRRWFILFDDGELTYSVDEHPDTIPQAIIDVNVVLEVSGAEEITGNKYAIAITDSEKVHFIKGTSQEESKRWFDVLSLYPRSHRGRQKRNSTFPGIKATSVNQSIEDSNKVSSQAKTAPRSRYLSCQSTETSSDITNENFPLVWNKDASKDDNHNEDAAILKPDHPVEDAKDEPEFTKSKKESTDNIEVGCKSSRRYMLRQSRGIRNQRSKSDGVSKMFPIALDRPKWVDDLNTFSSSTQRSDHSTFTDISSYNASSSSHEEKKSDKTGSQRISLNLTPNRRSRKSSESDKSTSVESSPYTPLMERRRRKSSHATSGTKHNGQHSHDDKPTSRGVPDGCGYDAEAGSHLSACSNLNLEIISDELGKAKKGWLMKLDSTQDWSRHWFVLRGTALMFYRDPTCEQKGILDGFIDLGLIQKIEQVQLTKYYGFKITTWDNSHYVFSAGSLSLRNAWSSALAHASNIDFKLACAEFDAASQSYAMSNKTTKELTNLKSVNDSNGLLDVEETRLKAIRSPSPSVRKSKPIDLDFTNKIIDSSSSSIGKDRIKNSSILISENRALPPSPPITRTPISRVKNKARSRSNSGTRSSRRRSKSTSSPTLMSDETDGSPPDLRTHNSKQIFATSKLNEADRKGMSTGDIVLVELLEAEVESLRTRLEQTQKELVVVHQTNLELQNSKQNGRKSGSKNDGWNEGCASGECSSLIQSLSDECQRLRNDGNSLREDVQKLNNDNGKVKKDQEELSRLRDDFVDLKSQSSWKEIVIQRQRSENQSLRKNLGNSKEEIQNLFIKLNKYSKEKNILTSELQESESRLESAENRLKKMKLASLVITEDFEKEDEEGELDEGGGGKNQLVKAQLEVRNVKKELRKAHCSYDELELYTMKVKHDIDAVRQENQSDSRMMAERIEDLTSKLGSAERTTRQLRLKLTKAENRQERRTRSLRGGKEALTISKEMEAKLTELENKMKHMDGSKTAEDDASYSASLREPTEDTAAVFLRLNKLSSKVDSAVEAQRDLCQLVPDIYPAEYKPIDENLTQQLKMRLKYMENIMEACKQKVSEVVCQMSSINCCCPSKNELLELKEDLATIHEVILGQCSSEVTSRDASRLCSAVNKMKNLVHDRLQQISTQRRKLKAAGMHSTDVEEKLMSEKLGLQSAVIKYVMRIVHSPEHDDGTASFWSEEIGNFSSILDEVDSIVGCTNGKKMADNVKDALKLMLNSSVKREADGFANSLRDSSHPDDRQPTKTTMENVKLKVENLRIKSSNVIKAIDDIFIRKVHVIVESSLEEDKMGAKNDSLKELMARVESHESWESVRSIFTNGVALSDLQNVILKLSKLYKDGVESECASASCWCLTEFQEVFLNRKQMEVLNHLEVEFSKATGVFVPKISQVLSDRSDGRTTCNLCKESCEVLEEAISLVALKAIIIAYLATIDSFVLQRLSMNSLNIRTGEASDDNIEGLIQSMLTNAELSFILNQAQMCQSQDGQYLLNQAKVEEVRSNYENMLQSERQMFVNVIDGLHSQIDTLEEAKVQLNKCVDCLQLQGNLEKVIEERQSEMALMKNQYESKIKRIEDHYKELAQQKDEKISDEENNLRSQIVELKQKHEAFQNEYENHVQIIKTKFEEELSHRLQSSINNDLHKHQYECEIEQLKELCKKGFSAMEKCHKHVIKEIEERHKTQLNNLRSEQEQALADETQATISALDSIKKAHDLEIQKELARLKEEYIQEHKSRISINPSIPDNKYHCNELHQIKEDIKEISSKFSSSYQVVDESAIKKTLESLTVRLAQSDSQILELKARNNQLQSYLNNKNENLMNSFSQNTSSQNKLQILLEVKSGELLKKNEELIELKNECESIKLRDVELQDQCILLQENLKIKKKVKEDEMKNFLCKLDVVANNPTKNITGNEDYERSEAMPELRRISLPEQKSRRPFKNLSFTYKRDIAGSSAILDDSNTLKSDV